MTESNSDAKDSDMQYILVTDVGSTTTKARFFEKREEGWRYVISGEAPTTVEKPYEDVTMGVRNAIREIEELTNHKILTDDHNEVIRPHKEGCGVDLYCTTSSAGGGLQSQVGRPRPASHPDRDETARAKGGPEGARAQTAPDQPDGQGAEGHCRVPRLRRRLLYGELWRGKRRASFLSRREGNRNFL